MLCDDRVGGGIGGELRVEGVSAMLKTTRSTFSGSAAMADAASPLSANAKTATTLVGGTAGQASQRAAHERSRWANSGGTCGWPPL